MLLGRIARTSVVELLPDAIFGISLRVLFVEANNVNDGLGVALLFLLRDTGISQNVLPLARESLNHVSQESRKDMRTEKDLQ